ncbi:MAG: hypothetical protein ABJA67_09565 [Chthonomonadales bacterium]
MKLYIFVTAAIGIGMLWAGNQAAQAQVKVDKRAKVITEKIRVGTTFVVSVSHVDEKSFDVITGPKAPPITVSWGPANSDRFILTGNKGWEPWGLTKAFVQDVDGDGKMDIVINSYCGHGGSGTAMYVTIAKQTDKGFVQVGPLATTAANIHSGAFYFATNKTKNTFVLTRPLDSGESASPNPRLWGVETYEIKGKKLAKVGSYKTKKRFTEKLPVAEIRALLPKGWTLGIEI